MKTRDGADSRLSGYPESFRSGSRCELRFIVRKVATCVLDPWGGGGLALHRLMLENAEKLDLLSTKCFINKYDY